MLLYIKDVQELKWLFEALNQFDFCMENKDSLDEIIALTKRIEKEIEHYETK